ncbi:Monocarboxylate transporter 10 [Nymphon striatum]|nr:Monocarboxylate transporter 10 [Nymphon striatum]
MVGALILYKGNQTKAVISWVGSVAVGVTFLMSPVASILTDKLGIRRTVFLGGIISAIGMLLSSFIEVLELLYLTYGVIMGFGASLIYTPSLVILGHYFDKRMGLVNGIVASGSSVFTAVMPKTLKYFINTFGLSHTMQCLSVLLALTTLSALVFKPLVVHNTNEFSKELEATTQTNSCEKSQKHRVKNCFHKLFNVKIWKNRQYVIWSIAFPSALFGYFVPYVHLVQYVENILPSSDSTIAITCIGISSGIGRIFFGVLADVPCVNRIHLQQVSFVMIGICTMLLVASASYPLIVILSFVIGLFDGCFISLLGPIAFDIVGTKSASQAIGFLLGLCSIPLMVGPPIAGAIYDHTNTYKVAFIIAGIPPIVGAILMCWIHRVRANYPAMSMENIVEDSFKTESVHFSLNHMNGDVVHTNGNSSTEPAKLFANTNIEDLKYVDDDMDNTAHLSNNAKYNEEKDMTPNHIAV